MFWWSCSAVNVTGGGADVCAPRKSAAAQIKRERASKGRHSKCGHGTAPGWYALSVFAKRFSSGVHIKPSAMKLARNLFAASRLRLCTVNCVPAWSQAPAGIDGAGLGGKLGSFAADSRAAERIACRTTCATRPCGRFFICHSAGRHCACIFRMHLERRRCTSRLCTLRGRVSSSFVGNRSGERSVADLRRQARCADSAGRRVGFRSGGLSRCRRFQTLQ